MKLTEYKLKKLFLSLALILVTATLMQSAPEVIIKGIIGANVFIIAEDGTFFMNSDQTSIQKFSKSGELLLTIGQAGSGPSDFRRISDFCIHPINGNLYVTEGFNGNRWISIFNKDGKYLGEWKGKLNWKKWNGLHQIRFDRQGYVYIQANRSNIRTYKDFEIGWNQVTILKFSPQGEFVKELYKNQYDATGDKSGKGEVNLPFRNSIVWDIYDDTLFVRDSWEPSINRYDLSGNKKKYLDIPFKKEKVTDNDIESWQCDLKTNPFYKRGKAAGWFDPIFWIKRIAFPEYRAISANSLIFSKTGTVYSQKYNNVEDREFTWFAIDIATNKTKSIGLKNYFGAISNDYFYFFVYNDKDDLWDLVRIKESEVMAKSQPVPPITRN